MTIEIETPDVPQESFFMKNLESSTTVITSLKVALSGDLPGSEAQHRMAHASRNPDRSGIPDDVRPAAVLITVYPREDIWHTVFIRRKLKAHDRHSGQISFPGGGREGDETLEETALRESNEEIGSPLETMHIIGQLTALHVPVSNYLVHPFVAYTHHMGRLSPQESEVAEIIEVPLQELLSENIVRVTNIRLSEQRVLRNVPCFTPSGQIIWGATAMILSEFLTVVRDIPGLHKLL